MRRIVLEEGTEGIMLWREVGTAKPIATRREAPLRAKDKDTTRRAVAVVVVVVVEMAKTGTAEVIISKAGRRASIVEATTTIRATTTTGRASKGRREMAST